VNPADDEEFGAGAEEARIEDFLLAGLRRAKNGLRRKSFDEIQELFDSAKHVDRSHWPSEVARFIDEFKRPQGRMRSRQADSDRFWSNPNRVAALFAAAHVRNQKELHGKRRYKIIQSDGSISTISAEAVRLAVASVNKALEKLPHPARHGFFPRRADPEQVATLLGKGKRRVNPPPGRFDGDPNPDY